MMNVDEHNRSSRRRTPSQPKSGDSLTQWIRQVVGVKQIRVRTRLQGNSLHILLESNPCPEATTFAPRLLRALTTTALERLLPSGSPQVYRIILYGRVVDSTKPQWTQSFYLNQSDSRVAPSGAGSAPRAARSTPTTAESAPDLPSTQDLARQGQPGAIARYLSEQLSHLGVAVRAKVDGGDRRAGSSQNPPSSETTSEQPSLKSRVQQLKSEIQAPSTRLLIFCESAYSPDPLLLAEPIAQHLRQLELKGFRDAVVFGQVRGEAKPEWLLRVDLTPPDKILREWARWGDVQAITRLLNRILLPQGMQISALLKESTLHLTCQGTEAEPPDKLTVIATIAPLLDSLSPQGIHGATLYGVLEDAARGTDSQPSASSLPSPLWVHWLDLPAARQPALAVATLELAQRGDLGAIGFLLTRLLNPNLDVKLATGGVQIQIRQKEDLLHIMSEALACPPQKQVGPPIARFLKPLQIPTVQGVRVYGRRAGQKQPLWSYGLDFAPRQRLVPEATPEFAASDTYVGDLLSPPGALVPLADAAPETWRSLWERWGENAVQRVQRWLIRSQVFAPLDPTAMNPSLTPEAAYVGHKQGALVALIWGTVGVLLVVQSDWILGRCLEPPPADPRPVASQSEVHPARSPFRSSPVSTPLVPAKSPFPQLSLSKFKPGDSRAFNSSGFTHAGKAAASQETEKGVFNASGFTQATTPSLTPETPTSGGLLPASPPQTKAAVLTMAGSDAYPTFNSRQLDQQLAVYRQYLEKNGRPDVLIIGSSRALRGVDPVALKAALAEQGYAGVKVFNFGVNGATAQVVELILHQILPQEALPKLVLWADGARAFNSGRLDITYNGIVASQGYKALVAGKPPIPGTLTAQAKAAPAKTAATNAAKPASVTEEASNALTGNLYQTLNQQLDRALGAMSLAYTGRDRLKTLLRDHLTAILPSGASAATDKPISGTLTDTTSPPAAAMGSPSVLTEGQETVDVNGFLALPNRFNPATYYQKYARVPGDYDSDYESFTLAGKQMDALTSLAQFTQAHQIALVFVNLPLTADYLDPIRKQHEDAFQQQMLQLSAQLGFTYRDLSQALPLPDYFSDPSHLNRYGGYEVSRRLAQDVLIPWNQAR